MVILADDLGSGDVQALNPDSKIPTPNLNALAASGMTFHDAHSPSAVCTPTRYGLLTGRYCWRSRMKKGVLNGYSPPLIEKDRPTFAQMLSSKGYNTAIVGKWHLGMNIPMLPEPPNDRFKGDPGVDFEGTITDSPNDRGFDYSFLVTASLDMAPYVYVRNGRFTQKPTIQQPAVKFPHFVRAGPRSEDFVIEETLDKLISEATVQIGTMAKKDDPFLLYLPLTGPHKPCQPATRFQGKTALGEYGDFVHQVDASVGRVLEAIRESGEEDNTLVIFTSDNGSYMYRYTDGRTDHVEDSGVQGFKEQRHRSNGPYRGTKADIWEAGHRVPFFVRWPGSVEAGSQCKQTICLTDIYATLAEIADEPLADNVAEDSFSIMRMLAGSQNPRPAPVIHHSGSGMFALRSGPWKLIAGNGSGGREAPKGKPFEKPFQLFNMTTDVGESHDLAEEQSEKVAHLTATLEDIRSHGSRATVKK
ncbi:MAG: arylsulfatase [Aureliella sp.]